MINGLCCFLSQKQFWHTIYRQKENNLTILTTDLFRPRQVRKKIQCKVRYIWQKTTLVGQQKPVAKNCHIITIFARDKWYFCHVQTPDTHGGIKVFLMIKRLRHLFIIKYLGLCHTNIFATQYFDKNILHLTFLATDFYRLF